MVATIIDGAALSREIRSEIAAGVEQHVAETGIIPGLAVVLVGEDPASMVYVRNKGRACETAGIFSETFNMPATSSEAEVLDRVDQLNKDDRFHGILVQSPLPSPLDSKVAFGRVSPEKDVDGLNPINLGKLLAGEPGMVPCTPAGIQQMLIRSGVELNGANVVICGRGMLVGRPLVSLLSVKGPGANATVTLCHTGTKDLSAVTRQADVLVAAMGSVNAITADMVREGVVVIDAGINEVPDASKKSGRRLVGDVDFDAVSRKASAITPVPGGVGPMTITMLLSNTLKAARLQAGKSLAGV